MELLIKPLPASGFNVPLPKVTQPSSESVGEDRIRARILGGMAHWVPPKRQFVKSLTGLGPVIWPL